MNEENNISNGDEEVSSLDGCKIDCAGNQDDVVVVVALPVTYTPKMLKPISLSVCINPRALMECHSPHIPSSRIHNLP